MQRRMARALDDDERVARNVLRGDEPGRVARVRASADSEAAALAERVALEAAVTADDGAVLCLYRPGAAGNQAADELTERPLADEADAGRVALAGDRQPALARHRPHLGLAQAADRELAVRELARVQRVEEIALVLVQISTAQQAPARADARVVPGREALGAEPLRVLEADAELHLPVAEDVGVRRPPGLEFGQEMREDARLVLGLETRLVQRDAELLADAASVLEVCCGRAICVLVLAPVGHEERLDAMARVEEQGGGYGGVDPAGQRDDDPGHGSACCDAEVDGVERDLLQQVERVARPREVVVDTAEDEGAPVFAGARRELRPVEP